MDKSISILLFVQVLQCISQILQSIILPHSKSLFIQIVCPIIILLKIGEGTKRQLWPIGLLVLQCVLYFEISVQVGTIWIVHTNTLLLILIQSQQLEDKLFSKWLLPLYCLIRLVGQAFIQQELVMIEPVLVMIAILIVLLPSPEISKLPKTPEYKLEQCEVKPLTVKSLAEFESERKNQLTMQIDQRNKTYDSFKKSQTEHPPVADFNFQPIPLNLCPLSRQRSNDPKTPSSIVRMKIARKAQKNLSFSSHENRPEQIHQFYQNIINIFPQGILIVNQHQKPTFINNVCEKLLECQGPDQVLMALKQGLQRYFQKMIKQNKQKKSAELPQDRLYLPTISKQYISQLQLFDLMKYYRNQQQEFDVLDALLNPTKYTIQTPKNSQVEKNKGFGHQNSAGSVSETLYFATTIKFEYAFYSEKSGKEKQLKVIVIPTQMTSSQQEQISLSSQQRLPRSSQVNIIPVISSETYAPLQNVLLIIVKSVGFKKKLIQLQREHLFHNSLLKSFSHELRTPLNCSIQMLQIAKDLLKTDFELQKLIVVALGSNQLLMYQINDILDYAAMQCDTFQYHWSMVSLGDIVSEIEQIYLEACISKSIQFTFHYEPSLTQYKLRTDKQRIMQVLVNLLNNSIKFTKQGGIIKLKINVENNLNGQIIRISVKDNGIGMGQEQLDTLKRLLIDPQKMGKSLHKKRIEKGTISLGLNISARIIEGLLLQANNVLAIKSLPNKGTTLSFMIQHQPTLFDNTTNPMITEQTIRNPLGRIQTMKSNKLSQFADDESLVSQNVEKESFVLKKYSPLDAVPFQIRTSSKKPSYQKSRFSQRVEELLGNSLEDVNSSFENSIEDKMPQTKSPQFMMQQQNKKKPEIPRQKSLLYDKKMSDNKSSVTVGNLESKQFSYHVNAKRLCETCVNVLIVDDIPFNHIALKGMLAHKKINVHQAYDGYQAMELIYQKMDTEHCKYYTLILMDIEMPGINGFQTTKEILKITRGNEPFIIMCSAYDTVENFEEGRSVGMVDFLPKPVRKEELERILKKYVQHNSET